MEAIILSKDQYAELVARLDEITTRLNAKNEPKKDTFLDNQEFLILMKISKRTAQTWRDEGRISFSQVGNKIYYKLSDVDFYLGVPLCIFLPSTFVIKTKLLQGKKMQAGRAIRYKSSLVPRCGLSATIPHAKDRKRLLKTIYFVDLGK